MAEHESDQFFRLWPRNQHAFVNMQKKVTKGGATDRVLHRRTGNAARGCIIGRIDQQVDEFVHGVQRGP